MRESSWNAITEARKPAYDGHRYYMYMTQADKNTLTHENNKVFVTKSTSTSCQICMQSLVTSHI